ncbi:unnamed protein product [Calypogeia fissa]
MEPTDRPMKEPDPQVNCQKIWPEFQQNLSQAEDVLDHNVRLIAEINRNHLKRASSSIPQNALLTRELSTNIHRVVDLYASLTHIVEGLFDVQNVDSSEDDNSGQVITSASKSPPSR